MKVKKIPVFSPSFRRSNVFLSEGLPLILGLLVFFYLLLPLRFWQRFVFPNQIEVIVISTYITLLISGWIILKAVYCSGKLGSGLHAIDVLLLVYLIYLGLYFFFQYQSINQEFIFEGFILIVLYIFFRLLSLQSAGYLLFLFPIAGIVQIIYGIGHQTDYFRPGYTFSDITGIFNNTGIFGGFIAITTITSLAIITHFGVTIYSRNYWIALRIIKVIVAIIFFILLFQLIASRSRAAWIAFLAGAGYLIINRYGLWKTFLKMTVIKKGLLFVTLLCFLSTLFIVLYRFKKESAEGRKLIWQVSLNMIKDRPLLGHGINGFQANYMEYQGEYFKKHPESLYSYLADDNRYAFNEFLKIWVETGAVGLLFWITILYLLFFKITVEKEDEKRDWIFATLKSVLLSILVFGLFSYPFSVLQFKIAAVFCIAVMSKYSLENKYNPVLSINGQELLQLKFIKATKIGMVGIGITFAFLLSQSLETHAGACKKWDTALKGYSTKNSSAAIETLEKIYPVLKNNGIYLSTFGKTLNKSAKYGQAIAIFRRADKFLPMVTNYIELGKSYKEIGKFKDAEFAWDKAAFMMPAMFTPKYLLAKMLYENGDSCKASNITKELLHKTIKIESPSLTRILKEMTEIVKSKNK